MEDNVLFVWKILTKDFSLGYILDLMSEINTEDALMHLAKNDKQVRKHVSPTRR